MRVQAASATSYDLLPAVTIVAGATRVIGAPTHLLAHEVHVSSAMQSRQEVIEYACVKLRQARSPGRGAIALRCTIGALACIITELPANSAAACGVCWCDDAPWESWISGGKAGVPRNPRLLVSTVLAKTGQLRSLAGDTVEFKIEASGDDRVVWLTPLELLERDETYLLSDPDVSPARGAGGQLGFVVTEGIDETPPSVRGSRVLAAAGTNECNLKLGADLEVDAIHDQERGGQRIYAQVDIRSRGGHDRVFLPLNAYAQVQQLSFGAGHPSAGTECRLTRAVRHAEVGADAVSQVTYYDLAGNAFAADPVVFQFAEVSPSSCPGPWPTPPVVSEEVVTSQDEVDAGAEPFDEDAGAATRVNLTKADVGCSVSSAGMGTSTVWIALGALVWFRRARRTVRA